MKKPNTCFTGIARAVDARHGRLHTWAFFVTLLVIVCAASACEMSATIDADHEPVLQIDAVFFNDEPLPVIRVRTSFRTTKNGEEFLVDRQALFVSNAQIELTRNGDSIPLVEESPGHYRPVSDDTAQAGDRFEIRVMKEDLMAAAVAEIPDKPIEEIVIDPVKEMDVVWGRGDFAVEFHFPFMPEFTALRVYSEEDWEEGQEWNLSLNSGFGNLNYQTYHARDHEGEEHLSIAHTSVFTFPVEAEDIGNEESVLLPFFYNMVIPEPIYETWHRHRDNFGDFTPITVTNVEGGVGLFIGAVRVSGEMEAEVVLTYKEG